MMAEFPSPRWLLFLTVALGGMRMEPSFAEAGDTAPPGKIAVVGAGIGGSSVAYFLQQHFGPQVQLDVYEKAVVGGRLATVTVNKQSYESGGAYFHSLNLHIEDFVQQLGLKHRREVAGKSAIFTGEQFVLEETDWYLLNLFRLWWHYGMSFLRLQMWVEEVMEKFMRIYKYQVHGYAFSHLEELLRSLGGDTFVNMTQRSVVESLLDVGVTQRFIDDVIMAILRANYGQSVLVPAFAGALLLAGAQGNRWAVDGGNKLVCSGLLKHTKANIIHATVKAISLHSSDGEFLLGLGRKRSEFCAIFSRSSQGHQRFPSIQREKTKSRPVLQKIVGFKSHFSFASSSKVKAAVPRDQALANCLLGAPDRCGRQPSSIIFQLI